MMNKPVLIVGSGPTGLVLALSLAHAGVPFRLISEAAGPGEHSRAMAVHARTLEFYRQFGFADEVVGKGVITRRVHLRQVTGDGRGHEVTTFSFNDLGDGISPYPFVLTFPQDDHERLLVDKLAAAGVEVEWNARLTDFVQDSTGVHATIAHTGPHAGTPTEEADFAYICGCDGAHSQVRRTLGLDFAGGTYEQLFYVADVRIDSDFKTDLYVNLGDHLLALMFPVRSEMQGHSIQVSRCWKLDELERDIG
jgi:2-polyprenyl-6-methoxyphenol hydroxylase-like FAD-dependent oxidoreductase